MDLTLRYDESSVQSEDCVGVQLGPDFVLQNWSAMEKELLRVPHIWNTYWTVDSIREAILCGAWQAWGFGPEGVVRLTVITRVSGFPAGAVLQIILAWGNSLDILLPVMEATFERVAQVTGCGYCEFHGRPGWQKKLSGFERAGVVLRKKVEHRGVH